MSIFSIDGNERSHRRYHQSLGYKTPYEVHYGEAAIIEELRK